jgi:carbonic anhydrase/acetyltransferase-like protein (isoleucine patch superfamily)
MTIRSFVTEQSMPVYALDGVSPVLPPPGQWWLAPDAHVIGDCTIGENVGIWFGAVLRGDNDPIRIGARSNIQEHAMLHTDIGYPLSVGEDCTIGHRAILHGCTIGNSVLIGMGATILNGAVIPDGCLVGANALVTEGKVFEPRSLIVGSPAKAIRTLDDAALARLKASAANYVLNWKRFATGLSRLPD